MKEDTKTEFQESQKSLLRRHGVKAALLAANIAAGVFLTPYVWIPLATTSAVGLLVNNKLQAKGDMKFGVVRGMFNKATVALSMALSLVVSGHFAVGKYMTDANPLPENEYKTAMTEAGKALSRGESDFKVGGMDCIVTPSGEGECFYKRISPIINQRFYESDVISSAKVTVGAAYRVFIKPPAKTL